MDNKSTRKLLYFFIFNDIIYAEMKCFVKRRKINENINNRRKWNVSKRSKRKI